MRRRLIGLLAGPILIAQCGPSQCAPEPPAPPPVTVTTTPPPPVTAPPVTTPPTTSWSFLSSRDGLYTHWTACSDPITYQIDAVTKGGPTAQERSAIAAALTAASAASGHTFSYVGDGGSELLPGADAVIGVDDLPTGTLGRGGGAFNGAFEMVSGTAYVDVGLQPDLLATTLLHEVGHLLGLGHATDRSQLMYAAVRQVAAEPPRFLQAYQPGDLEGLRLVGTSVQTAPCLADLRVGDDEPIGEIILD